MLLVSLTTRGRAVSFHYPVSKKTSRELQCPDTRVKHTDTHSLHVYTVSLSPVDLTVMFNPEEIPNIRCFFTGEEKGGEERRGREREGGRGEVITERWRAFSFCAVCE